MKPRRLTKQEKIALLLPQATEIEPDVFEVPSVSGKDSHTVHWFGIGGRCDCKSYEYRQWCIHLDVVKLLKDETE